MGELNFKEGSGAQKLQLDGNPDVAGDQTRRFKVASCSSSWRRRSEQLGGVLN
jgi:hypothetical protein